MKYCLLLVSLLGVMGCSSADQSATSPTKVSMLSSRWVLDNDVAIAELQLCLNSWQEDEEYSAFITETGGSTHFADNNWQLNRWKLQHYKVVGVRMNGNAIESLVEMKFKTNDKLNKDVHVIYTITHIGGIWCIEKTEQIESDINFMCIPQSSFKGIPD